MAQDFGTKAGGVESSSTSDVPVLGRFKWLKRFCWAGAGVVVTLVLLRIVWGMVAEGRLTAQIAIYRAEGGPVTVDDFDAEMDLVPDEDNAALIYERAFSEYVAVGASGEVISMFTDEPSTFASEAALADEFMVSNDVFLQSMREARALPSVAWSVRLRGQPWQSYQGSYVRMSARVLDFAIVYQIRHGEHGQAIEMYRDFLRFNDAQMSFPTVISFLISVTCFQRSYTILEDHAAGLVVGLEHASDQVTPVTRAQIRQLIHELLEEAETRDASVRTFLGNRASGLHALETMGYSDALSPNALTTTGTAWLNAALSFAGRPILVLEMLRSVQEQTECARGALEDTWMAASRHLTPLPERETLQTYLMNVLAYGEMFRRVLQLVFELRVRRRMAAVALAVRLYEVDHGARPQTLSELTPLYLPIPVSDPLTTDERPLRYSPNKERGLLYSVGFDGRDDGGATFKLPNGTLDRERSDIRFYLDPELPGTSAEEAGDDEHNVEHD